MKLLLCNQLIILISLSRAKIDYKMPARDDINMLSEPDIGPKGMPYNKTTSCQTFGQYARFNPHSVVGKKWFVFYYWAMPQQLEIFQFKIPDIKEKQLLHRVLDGHLPKRFNWSSTLVLRRSFLTNDTTLLEERGDRGEYLEYGIFKDIPQGQLTLFRSIRIKQTGDGKYLAIVHCRDNTAIIMSELNAVPPQNMLQQEAARLGYRGRKGKSYLYQGHEWMPIPEQDEREFWFINRKLLKL